MYRISFVVCKWSQLPRNIFQPRFEVFCSCHCLSTPATDALCTTMFSWSAARLATAVRKRAAYRKAPHSTSLDLCPQGWKWSCWGLGRMPSDGNLKALWYHYDIWWYWLIQYSAKTRGKSETNSWIHLTALNPNALLVYRADSKLRGLHSLSLRLSSMAPDTVVAAGSCSNMHGRNFYLLQVTVLIG